MLYRNSAPLLGSSRSTVPVHTRIRGTGYPRKAGAAVRFLRGTSPAVVGEAALPALGADPDLQPMNATERITIEPGKRGGKPCIRGLRITVDDVLSYLASGMTEAEILADFPDLEHEDYLAVHAFAADREGRIIADPAA